MPWSDESDQGITANCQLPPGQRNNYLAAAEEAGAEAAAESAGAEAAAEEAVEEAVLPQAVVVIHMATAMTQAIVFFIVSLSFHYRGKGGRACMHAPSQ